MYFTLECFWLQVPETLTQTGLNNKENSWTKQKIPMVKQTTLQGKVATMA